ncbi:glycosyl transferase family 90-domain-containing protein [Chiua virens]|nr:glycosyl transferase family 90-domain-containing protein [Chiua virens]
MMVHTWISLRWTLSQRYLTALFLVSVLTISLRSLFVSHAVHYTHIPLFSYHVPFGHLELDLAPNGQVTLRNLLETVSGPDPKHRPPKRPLGAHTLTPDGLLVVNPDGPHPIFQLIRDAELEWEEKHARASKTLHEAVAEYRRRYRRAPPLGFDKWWDYVVTHHVQLPDEYDEIYQDIEPFWGIDPTELAHAQKEFETQSETVTVEKTDTLPRFKVVDTTLPPNRQDLLPGIENILELVREVELDIPSIRLTFSPLDNPDMLSDWQIKSMALEAAANGTTLMNADMPPVKEGWIQACPPDSPARLHPPKLPPRSTASSIPPSSPKTFIASHRDAMNPCLNPSLLTSHGQFLSYGKGPVSRPTLVPRFSLCATVLHHDIRPPVPYGWDWNSDANSDKDWIGAFEGDVPWERKVDERLSWRGRTTGMWASPTSPWVHSHRARLATLASTLEGNVDVLLTPEDVVEEGEEGMPIGEPETVRLAHVNPAWMDIAFADGPIACDKRKGTCTEMEEMWEFRRSQGRREEGRYKFILDVDGNGWSGRFKRLMTSNALVFKSTVYPEWYASRIAPWAHYVPIQVSYADLYDAVAFFRAHDELAARIAKAGRDWSRRYWRREDMTAYLYRLLLEYARVSSLNRPSMDYVG